MLEGYDQLTTAERAIYDFITEGHSNEEIAEMAHVSVGTVKFHCTRLFNKLGVSSRSRLIANHWREKFKTKGPSITLTLEQLNQIYQLPFGAVSIDAL